MSYKNCTKCGSKSHYAHQCTTPNYHNVGHHQPPPCTPMHCDPCQPAVICNAVNDVTAAPARPLLAGSPQFVDPCGNVASGWFITVNDPISGKEKTVYTDPSKVQVIPQPIRLNQQGRVTGYTTGKYIVTLYEPDSCNNLGKAVDKTVTQGGDFEGDFPLNPSPMLECIDDNCSVRVYNNEGCIYPKGLTSPKALAIQGAIGAGQVAGKWSEVKAYFECKNEPIPECTLVLGDITFFTYKLKVDGDPAVDPEDADEGANNWDLICCSGSIISSGSFGGGVCVIVESAVDYVYQSRDGAIVDGGPVNSIAGNPPGPLVISITNPWPVPAILEIDMTGIGDNDQPDLFGDETFVWSLGDTELVTFPDWADMNNVSGNQTNLQAFAPAQLGAEQSVEIGVSGTYARTSSAALNIKTVLAANESKTFYGQWWLYLRNHTANPLGSLYHGTMYAKTTLIKNGSQV